MNQQGGGVGGFEWVNYNNSNVLAPSTPVMTLDSLSNVTLPGSNAIICGTSVAVPTSTTSNNYVQFLQYVITNGPATIELSVVVSSTSFSEAYMYTVPVQFSGTSGIWQSLIPNLYSYASTSLRIDVWSSSNTMLFRLVRINGSVAGTAMISAKITGNGTFTIQSTVGTDTTIPAVYIDGGGSSISLSGSWGNPINLSQTIVLTVIHRTVTMIIPGLSGTTNAGGGATSFSVAIPSQYLPKASYQGPGAYLFTSLMSIFSGAYNFGQMSITTSGTIIVGFGSAASFPVSSSFSWWGQSFSWQI